MLDHVFQQKAEGQRAQLAYEKALRDGFVNVYRGRILLIGQDRAGKTSLKKSLLGLPFDPKEQSTEGIDLQASTCEIEVEQVKNWNSTRENKLGLVISPKEISRMVAKTMCDREALHLELLLDKLKCLEVQCIFTVLCKSNANDNQRYIKRYIVRAIVLFLGEMSLSLCEISFPASDISFPLCDISFRLCNISFPLRDIYRFCFGIYRFRLARYRSSLASRHCEIHVHFPKDNLR